MQVAIRKDMFLNRLKKSPLEAVRITARKTIKVWVARERMETPWSNEMKFSFIFSPTEIDPGAQIEIDGLGNVRMTIDDNWLQVRIFDIGVNVDRQAISLDDAKRRAIAQRILPFQYCIGQGMFSVGPVFRAPLRTPPILPKIPRHLRDQLLANADLLQTVGAPSEWQDMRTKCRTGQEHRSIELQKKTA